MKKYEQEIRELLDKLENFVPETPATEREREPKKKVVGVMPPAPKPIPLRLSPTARFSRWLRQRNISMGWVFIIFSFSCVIAGLIIHQMLPSLNVLAQILAIVGAVSYLVPVLLRFFTGRDVNSDPKYWRGQMLEDEPVFNWSKVRQWLGGNKRNRSSNSWNDRNRSNRW